MSFNWPTIPFTGAEVEAFVTAYKELAEEIYNDYKINGDIGGSFPDLKVPYKTNEVIKILFEEGLFYASFIVKQRAGNSGPGTNFDLNTSPLKLDILNDIAKYLGCVFTQQDMSDSWDENHENNPGIGNPGNSGPDGDDDDIDDFVDYIIKELLDGFEGDPSNLNMGKHNTNTVSASSENMTAWENFLINTWNVLNLLNPMKDMIVTAIQRYLSDNKNPITNANFSENQILNMKNEVQRLYDRPKARWPNGSPNGGPLGVGPSSVDVTSKYNLQQQQAFNVPNGGTIREMPFYGTDLESLLGVATVVVNSVGKVISVHDDFDFAYGNEVNRSNTNQIPGQNYNQNQIQNGSDWNVNGVAQTREQVLANREGIHRAIIIEAHTKTGRGTPVPINIILN
jgi:hypothetical protein